MARGRPGGQQRALEPSARAGPAWGTLGALPEQLNFIWTHRGRKRKSKLKNRKGKRKRKRKEKDNKRKSNIERENNKNK